MYALAEDVSEKEGGSTRCQAVTDAVEAGLGAQYHLTDTEVTEPHRHHVGVRSRKDSVRQIAIDREAHRDY